VHRLEDARIKWLEITNNGVIAASRNLGIRNARGQCIAFLDSDDIWKPDKLEKAMFWLEQGYDIVYHDMNIISNKRVYFGRRKFLTRQLSSPILNDLLVNGNTLPTSSVVVRKDVLDKAGGFREDAEIIAGEDYELWLKISSCTQRFKRIDGMLGYLTKGNENAFSAKRLISIISEIERDYIGSLSPEEQRRARGNWIDYAYARAQYVEGDFAMARNKLSKILARSHNPSFRLKAAFMLVAIAMRRGVGRDVERSPR
jgi:glycosyltransferase involved in cell wall biosynthesis